MLAPKEAELPEPVIVSLVKSLVAVLLLRYRPSKVLVRVRLLLLLSIRTPTQPVASDLLWLIKWATTHTPREEAALLTQALHSVALVLNNYLETGPLLTQARSVRNRPLVRIVVEVVLILVRLISTPLVALVNIAGLPSLTVPLSKVLQAPRLVLELTIGRTLITRQLIARHLAAPPLHCVL